MHISGSKSGLSYLNDTKHSYIYVHRILRSMVEFAVCVCVT